MNGDFLRETWCNIRWLALEIAKQRLVLMEFTSFLLLCIISSCGYSQLLLLSPVEKCLGCFPFLAVIEKLQKPLCTGFCVNIGFHFTWVNTEQWNFWLVDKHMFNFIKDRNCQNG